MTTTKEIYDEIVAEKNSYQELQNLQPNIDDSQRLADDLTTNAKVGVWRVFTWIIASRIKDLQDLFVQSKTEIQNIMDRQRIGGLLWYQQIVKAFQYGDALIFNADKIQYEYPVINRDHQIVALASANEGSQHDVLLKVAKLNGTEPEPLTQPELDALTNYINRLKFAGVQATIVSRSADLFRVALNVYYDPLVMNADGSLINDDTVFPVEDAINDYLKDLPFDGTFSVTELIDKIQQSEGVINPIFISADAKFGNFVYQSITDYYNTNAGFLRVDDNYPLSSTINYVVAP